jgi:hypothetical protein
VVIISCANLFSLLGFFLLRLPLLPPLPLAIAMLFSTVGFFCFLIAYQKKFILYIRRKHDSFMKRHKDLIGKIVLLLVGSVLGVLGQLVVKKLTAP